MNVGRAQGRGRRPAPNGSPPLTLPAVLLETLLNTRGLEVARAMEGEATVAMVQWGLLGGAGGRGVFRGIGGSQETEGSGRQPGR